MRRVLGCQQQNRTRSIGAVQLEEANIVSIVRKFHPNRYEAFSIPDHPLLGLPVVHQKIRVKGGGTAVVSHSGPFGYPASRRLPDISRGELINDPCVAGEKSFHLQFRQPRQGFSQFEGVRSIKIDASYRIIGIDDIARHQNSLRSFIKGNAARGVPGDMNYLPLHAAEVECLSTTELTIHLNMKRSRTETIPRLAHASRHIAVDNSFISLFKRRRLKGVDPQFC